MPEEGVKLISHQDILSYEEILNVVKVAVEKGVTKVRITGGEPLIKRNIIGLVSMIAEIDAIRDFGMTTNGILLSKYATQLADAGLHRVNVSLDAVDPEKYKEITRGGDVTQALDGIDAAIVAGLTPIKINCVINESSTEKDAEEVTEYAVKKGIDVRFIRRMTTDKGEFWPVEGGDGGECSLCNRLRLSSNGMIRPCLFSDIAYSVREHGARKAIELALSSKPKSGQVSSNKFYEVGG